MAKCILMSIKPKYVSMILNKAKTIEVRKRFPSDYVGWVYIYVTRNKPYLYHERTNIGSYDFYELTPNGVQDLPNYKHAYTVGHDLNGKVVARFWCDKVGKISSYPYGYEMYLSGSILTRDIQVMKENEICEKACLTKQELRKYIPCDKERTGYAIHITKLEIFDKPKEIKEFIRIVKNGWDLGATTKGNRGVRLTSAPQSWQFIEVDL